MKPQSNNVFFSLISKLLVVIPLAMGCDSETKYQACKCEGELVSFENYRGMVAQTRTNDFVIVSDQLGYIAACPDLEDNLKVDGTKVVFAGRYIKNCQTQLPSYGGSNFNVQLTNIQKSDTIFTGGPLVINAIPSQDYYGNYTNGFGYFINFKDIFKIKQRSIPAAVDGYVPFKTSADAFKIAIRVGYRLNTSKDFPSTTYADLYYLKILD
jgi:hypothetical protein